MKIETIKNTKEMARSFFWVKFTRGLVFVGMLGIPLLIVLVQLLNINAAVSGKRQQSA